MRVLFLNRSFWPDTDATGVLLGELAKDLAELHEVTVICGPANTSARPSGVPLKRERYGAVRIVRTWGAALSKRSLTRRLVNLGLYWTLAAIAGFREHPDIVVAETDPPLLGLLGAFIKQIRGCRFIYYCQDVYPDIAEAIGGLEQPVLLWLLRRANNFAYRRADAIVALGDDMADRIRQKGVPAERIVTIPNWVDCRKITPYIATGSASGGKFVVMYAGNLGLSQGLETVLQAADLMRDDRLLKFVLVGDGARKDWLERKARAMRLENVEFVARQNPEAMSDYLAACNLQLIPLAPGVAGCLVPSKVYGILAAGRPFIAMMEDYSDVACLASEFDVGFAIPPGDPLALARAISDARKNPARLIEMGYRGRKLAEEKFDRRVATRHFAQLLETVAFDQAAVSSGTPAAESTLALKVDARDALRPQNLARPRRDSGIRAQM